MGLLDDAIREHLDLKRRRGADPAEIERAEREALGPVRRGPETEPAALVGDELEADQEYEDDGHAYEDEPAWHEPGAEEHEVFGDEEPPSFGHVPADEPEPQSSASAPTFDRPEPPAQADEFATRVHQDEPELFDDEEHEAPGHDERHPSAEEPPPAPPRPHPGQETAEYDVEQELDQEGDDVLEETPEFLQDTPDHDRLWFEQRPPRDFDFDG
jgi:hypothetical protein